MKFLALCAILGVASVQALINGDEAPASPHFVFVEFSSQNIQGHFGGGSLISSIHVITSGQNIHNFERWACSMGSNVRTNMQQVISNAAVAHPEFDPATRDNDIGLILLPFQMTFTASLMPIALPPINGDETPYFNEEGQLLSLGPANNIGNPAIMFLRRAFQRVVTDQQCQQAFQNINVERSFCAFDNNRRSDICWGGQGTGFTVKQRGREVLFGVSSISTCGGQTPSTFSRISAYRQWIFDFIQI